MNKKNDLQIVLEFEKTHPKAKQQSGFAVMDKIRQRQIASQGGKTAHLLGVAHRFNKKEAIKAGRIGGRARKNVVI